MCLLLVSRLFFVIHSIICNWMTFYLLGPSSSEANSFWGVVVWHRYHQNWCVSTGNWLRFVISLRIRFHEWTAGKLPTYFSRDTECLEHNMSMISCKLVHPFFPSRPHYLKAEAKYIRQTSIIHHPSIAPFEMPWGELHMSDDFLVYFLIAFEYFHV